MRVALYQPDIAQNTGAILRTMACLGVAVDIIGPSGFVFDDRRLRRAGLDYLELADLSHHESWAAFQAARRAAVSGSRLVLLTRHAGTAYTDFHFAADDVLLLGRESAGVPGDVAAAADARIGIPLRAETRSLNVAVAAAMVTGEALRQTAQFPALSEKPERKGDAGNGH